MKLRFLGATGTVTGSRYLVEAAQANRYGWSKHAPALPLYAMADASAALERLVAVKFGERFSPAAGIEATLAPAGHILGASIVSLRGAGRTVVFSGDLGRGDDPLMRPPARVAAADALVLESTYGGRSHAREDSAAELARIVSATARRGGVVIVPAFAVGRAQLLMLLLARAREAGSIPEAVRIYLDSPMACDVTALYDRFAAEHRMAPGECRAMAHVARHVRTPQESRALDGSSWPMVIIAGSGMATGGRVLHHLKRFAPDARNTIVLAGFQAGGTRGADLARGAREIKIHGEWVNVRAEVRALEGLSAHADERGLVDWLSGFAAAPRRIFLTHGEPDGSEALRKRIAQRLGWRAEVPEHLESVEV